MNQGLLLHASEFQKVQLLRSNTNNTNELWECIWNPISSPPTIVVVQYLKVETTPLLPTTISHQNIVPILGYFIEDNENQMGIVMEMTTPPVLFSLLKQLTLFDALHLYSKEKLFHSMFIQLQFMIDITSALHFLQTHHGVPLHSSVWNSKSWMVNESMSLQLLLDYDAILLHTTREKEEDAMHPLRILFIEILQRREMNLLLQEEEEGGNNWLDETMYPMELIGLLKQMQSQTIHTLGQVLNQLLQIQTQLLHTPSNYISTATTNVSPPPSTSIMKQEVTMHKRLFYFGISTMISSMALLIVILLCCILLIMKEWSTMNTNSTTTLLVTLQIIGCILSSVLLVLAATQMMYSGVISSHKPKNALV